jgi:hypothetical protein
MNERIKELAEQAELTKGVWKTPDFILEKFAELLIRETLIAARSGVEFGPSMEEAVEAYFGIKL